MRSLFLSVCLLSVGLASVATAQDWMRYGNPFGYGSGYHHASTAEEGIQRGFADVVRSAGAANLMNSEAAINYEDARRKNIDNRIHSTDAYFEMRAMNRRARDAERGPRPTMEDAIRYSEARKPDGLSASELDGLTGAISWPLVLQSAPYTQDRETMEELYSNMAVLGYLDTEGRTRLRETSQHMKDVLRSNMSSYSANEFVAAMKFIDGLVVEAQRPPK